ncbi:hypothetical protein [Vibrio coralliirubri]|uniref:hypothetical protein n=1 Tax=Vibrio coralliirubri TaxID=1516159 RepID=UPI00063317FC|nr:hypothetical protein [Vibrio coralliirubri]CDU13662.1 conserved exported hypothetical protein [Vibrio coralliirubri]
MKKNIKLLILIAVSISADVNAKDWQLTENTVSIMDKANGYFITTDNHENMTIVFKQSCDNEPAGPVNTMLNLGNSTSLSAISHCDPKTQFKAIVPNRAAREYIQMLLRSGLAIVIEDKYISPNNYKEAIKKL